MTIQEAQEQVDQWIKTYGVRYFSELTNMAILTEEVGELARIMARTYGDQSFKKSDLGKDLGDEMADIDPVIHVELGEDVVIAGRRIDFGRNLPVGKSVRDGVGLAELAFDLDEEGLHGGLREESLEFDRQGDMARDRAGENLPARSSTASFPAPGRQDHVRPTLT